MQESISTGVQIIHDRKLRLFQDAPAISARVQEIGQILTRVHAGHHLVVIGILHGAFIFTADLVRAIKRPCTVDFWRLSSYGNRTVSSKSVQEIMYPTVCIRNQHVILVEDIIDSGRTLTYVRERLLRDSPKSVTVVSLVKVQGSPVEVDYAGFLSNGGFLVGYGLDIAHQLRELPALYYLEQNEQGI